MLTKSTFKRKERLINVAVMRLKSVELKASSQHKLHFISVQKSSCQVVKSLI